VDTLLAACVTVFIRNQWNWWEWRVGYTGPPGTSSSLCSCWFLWY